MKIGDAVLIAIPTVLFFGFALRSKRTREVVGIFALGILALAVVGCGLFALAEVVAPYSSQTPDQLVVEFIGIAFLLWILVTYKSPTEEDSDAKD